ncbi:MAG: hydantoinase B/oxoprolinase family protein [Caulobacteraceae bacterium]|nr:hydantoinase B/oxoprolinase family protein [Caulobacteraceae bacterium]
MADGVRGASPITTEILRNAFVSIAEDMNAALIRSAYSPLIYEGKDCAVALLDQDGNVLGQSLGVPLFLGNLSLCVQTTAEMHGWDFFQEGDVIFLNDSYIAGTHLNDVTVIQPIFWRGQRVGFSTSRAHWLDVGGKDTSLSIDSTEIYQEGMRWAPTKVYEGGKPRRDILDFLRRNSRFGATLIGDLHAQIAAGETGEQRLRALLDRFGYDTVQAARQEIFGQSERLEREAVRAIPDGVYTAEGCLDNDGVGAAPVPVKLKIVIDGDSVALDLEGSAPQTRGSVNCGFTQTISAARLAFKLLINPGRPVDGGTFHTLKVAAPPNSIFNAQEPAACAWYFSSLGLLIDLFLKAMAPAMPDQVAAAHYGDSMVISFNGVDSRTRERFLVIEATTGGWGAWARGDGQDSLINEVNGSFRDLPVEIFEHKYPARILKYAIRTDSGGAGQFRGGNGTVRQYQLMDDANLSLWFERSVTPAWGLSGGAAGLGPEVVIQGPDGAEERLLKVNAKPLKAGTVITVSSGGGGGFGPVGLRAADQVRSDVQNRFVSPAAAAATYGVTVT